MRKLVKHALWSCMTLMLGLSVWATSALALDPFPKQAGFSGFFQPSVGYLSIKSNMAAETLGTDLSSKQISSLFAEPGSESSAIVSFPFKLAYTFDSLRTQVFLGTQLEDLATFDLAQQLGVMQDLGSIGVVQVGFLFSSIPTKVWKDPYVVNFPRESTDRNSAGAQLTLDKAFGTNFEFQYSYRNIDIDQELSGQFLGLSVADQKLLDRNGTQHKVSLSYNLKLDAKQRLIPQITYTNNDRDGGAMRNTAIMGQVTYAYLADPATLIINAGYGQSEADKANPIFGKTDESDLFGASAAIWYKNPWGWQLFGSKPLQLTLSGAYALKDSNIDFYIEEATLVAVGMRAVW